MRKLLLCLLIIPLATIAQSPFDYDNSRGGGSTPVPEAGIGVTGTINHSGQVIEGTKVTIGGLAAKEVDAPLRPTTAVAAGTLAAGNYEYVVTARNASGSTMGSFWISRTLAAPGGVQLTWTPVIGAISYEVYGRTYNSNTQLYMATIAAPTVTWTDDGSIVPAGATPRLNGTAPVVIPGLTMYTPPIIPDDSTVLDHVWFDSYHPVSSLYSWTCTANVTFNAFPLYSATNFLYNTRFCNPRAPITSPIATIASNWTGLIVFKATSDLAGGIAYTGNDSTTGWRLRVLPNTLSTFPGQFDLRIDFDGYAGGTKFVLLQGACTLDSLCAVCFGANADRIGMAVNYQGPITAVATLPFAAGNIFRIGQTSLVGGEYLTIYEAYFSAKPLSPGLCRNLISRAHALYPVIP